MVAVEVSPCCCSDGSLFGRNSAADAIRRACVSVSAVESPDQVAVPDGCFPGSSFVVSHDGQELEVAVPDGCAPGDVLAVEMPDAAPPEGGDAPLEVTVPDGCDVGSSFLVELPDGRQIEITVPEGCGPGMLLSVAVPPAEEPAPAPAPPPPLPSRPAPPPRSQHGQSSSGSGGASSSRLFDNYSSPYLPAKDSWPAPYAPAPAPAPAPAATEWAPATSLFAMGPSEGFGREGACALDPSTSLAACLLTVRPTYRDARPQRATFTWGSWCR
jgi:hypothetical protein